MKTRFNTANWVELVGGSMVHMSAYEPNPNSSHDNFYYNTSENKLYKLIDKYDNSRKIRHKHWIAIVEEY